MKLFKHRGGGCEHTMKKRREARDAGVKYTGDIMCQRCCFYDTKLYFWLTIPLIIAFQPFWWIMYGRKMDKKGFMPNEKGYNGKDRS